MILIISHYKYKDIDYLILQSNDIDYLMLQCNNIDYFIFQSNDIDYLILQSNDIDYFMLPYNLSNQWQHLSFSTHIKQCYKTMLTSNSLKGYTNPKQFNRLCYRTK